LSFCQGKRPCSSGVPRRQGTGRRYNSMGKAEVKQPKKSDGCIVRAQSVLTTVMKKDVGESKRNK